MPSINCAWRSCSKDKDFGILQMHSSQRPSRRPRPRLQRRGWLCLLCLLLGLLASPLAWAGPSGDLGGMELTSPVRHQLWRLQHAWQGWSRAFNANERETADSKVEEMLGIGRHLGMARLPDLGNAAAGYATKSATGGDFERAYWALEVAEQLDPGRPESAFARSTVQRLEGKYIGALVSGMRGYIATLQMPLQRKLWLNNLSLWLVYSLLMSGGVFVALLMVAKGRNLFYDLSRLYSPPLDPMPAAGLTVVLLLWPLVLPSGLTWLALYWSVLLWAYCSSHQRGGLIALWILLGLTPVVMSYQQRATQVALVPASRLVDNLAAGRLYGSIFSDLEVLRTMVPDSDIVTEIVADLHRRLGQWDYARAIYTELAQDPERSGVHSAPAYTNIGVFHHRRGDYETALNYFKRATDANPQLPEAFYNLSQAHGLLYDFKNQHEAMARAKELAGDQVDKWEDLAVTAEESAVGVDGGLRRVEELRRRLARLWQREQAAPGLTSIWRRSREIFVTLAAIALAFVLSRLRRQTGAVSDRLEESSVRLEENKWVRALVPGLASVHRGSGGMAYLGIFIPVSLLMVFVVRGVGYRAALAVDPGHWLAVATSLILLLMVFAVRLFLEHLDS